MGHAYRAVGWNRQKRLYDGALAGGIALYLAVFLGLGFALFPDATAETLLIRAFGTAALALLHVVLSIGPLCRLDPRFLPLLYNRRHLGVAMFLLALAHGTFALVQFHALGDVNPLASLFSVSSGFQVLGAFALMQLFAMAATSHDFWLANLSAPVWKRLHMGVYVAWALAVLHVALGVLQAETSPVLAVALLVGVAWILGLHLAAGWRGAAGDRPAPVADDGWVSACRADEIEDSRARIVSVAGERVAVFRYGERVSALSNVCQHQNGPLGEGRVIDGLVTCPWHGYQYKPDCGRSPEPFTEVVPTFRARVADGVVQVHARPLPPGTPVEPARVGPARADRARGDEEGEEGEA